MLAVLRKTQLVACAHIYPYSRRMTRPNAPPLPEFFTYRLHSLKKLTDKATESVYLETLGVTLSDARCVSAVGHFGATSVGDLAVLANLDKSQASRAADSLVKRGIFDKTTHPSDNRAVQLRLSRSGTALCKKILKIVELRNDEICGCLSPIERATLDRLLNRLIDQAKEPS
jgi:DNA-binding MarR family transcriptional regulator